MPMRPRSRSVHALEDHEQRPAVPRVQPLLKIAEKFSVRLDEFFTRLLVEAAPFVGLVRPEAKSAPAIEPVRSDERFQPLEERWLGLCLRLLAPGRLAHGVTSHLIPPPRHAW